MAAIAQAGMIIEAERLECQITFGSDIGKATHQYRFKLLGVGDTPALAFYWDIPNAVPDDVDLKKVKEEYYNGSKTIEFPNGKKVDSPLHNNGTRIEITYIRPLNKGETKELSFEYEAPSSAVIENSRSQLIGVYHVHLSYAMAVKTLELTVTFPHRTCIAQSLPPGTVRSAAVVFKTNAVAPGQHYMYQMLFRKRKTLVEFTKALLLVATGALAHAFGAGLLTGLYEIAKSLSKRG